MSQVREFELEARQLLNRLLTPVADELAAVDRRLQQELRHPDPFIDELAKHSFRLGGKRLRPALLLLSAQAVGSISDDHRILAAVVEMVHTATLIHDDVLDEATIRRHRETVNARWSNQASVLLGDYLFTHAFALASSLDTNFGSRTLVAATNKVCEGELRQNAASGDFWLSREDYLAIIDAKTAELCACCCLVGAHYAGATPETACRLSEYGRHVGMAFQIADDLLDLEGNEELTGKSLGTDLNHRKMTLPLICLRDALGKPDLERLQALFDESDASHTSLLIDWLEDSGAMQQARGVAEEYARNAAAELTTLPNSPAKQTLLDVARFVVARDS